MKWVLPLIVLLSAAMIAGAVLVSGRYEIAATPAETVWRLDQWSGQLEYCGIGSNGRKACFAVP